MSQIAFYGFAFLLIISAINVVLARNAVHSVLLLIFAFFNTAALFLLLGAEFIAMILIIVYVGAVAILFLFVVMMINLSDSHQRSLFSRINLMRSFATLFFTVKYASVFLLIYCSLVFVPILAELYQQHVFDNYSIYQCLKIAIHSRWLTLHTYQGIDNQALCVAVTALIISLLATGRILKHPYRHFPNTFLDSLVFLILADIMFMVYFIVMISKWRPLAGSEYVIASPIPPPDLMSNTHAIGQVLYTDYILAFQCGGIILLIAIIGTIVLTIQDKSTLKRQNARDQIARQVHDTLELKNIPIGSGYHE